MDDVTLEEKSSCGVHTVHSHSLQLLCMKGEEGAEGRGREVKETTSKTHHSTVKEGRRKKKEKKETVDGVHKPHISFRFFSSHLSLDPSDKRTASAQWRRAMNISTVQRAIRCIRSRERERE